MAGIICKYTSDCDWVYRIKEFSRQSDVAVYEKGKFAVGYNVPGAECMCNPANCPRYNERMLQDKQRQK